MNNEDRIEESIKNWEEQDNRIAYIEKVLVEQERAKEQEERGKERKRQGIRRRNRLIGGCDEKEND